LYDINVRDNVWCVYAERMTCWSTSWRSTLVQCRCCDGRERGTKVSPHSVHTRVHIGDNGQFTLNR